MFSLSSELRWNDYCNILVVMSDTVYVFLFVLYIELLLIKQ